FRGSRRFLERDANGNAAQRFQLSLRQRVSADVWLGTANQSGLSRDPLAQRPDRQAVERQCGADNRSHRGQRNYFFQILPRRISPAAQASAGEYPTTGISAVRARKSFLWEDGRAIE